MPVHKPDGLGPAPVWPIEFYAAIGIKLTYERGQYEEMDLSHKPALVIEDGVIENGVIAPDLIPYEDSSYEDNQETLIQFIGVKNYNYIFENPV